MTITYPVPLKETGERESTTGMSADDGPAAGSSSQSDDVSPDGSNADTSAPTGMDTSSHDDAQPFPHVNSAEIAVAHATNAIGEGDISPPTIATNAIGEGDTSPPAIATNAIGEGHTSLPTMHPHDVFHLDHLHGMNSPIVSSSC